MEDYVIWLLVGLILIGVEIVTGTFYLLVLGIAAFAAALVAYLGMGMMVEALAVSIVSVVGLIAVSKWRKGQKSTAESNNIDVGQTVIFVAWVSEDSRIARVKYRDTNWEAEVLSSHALKPHDLLWICGANGNQLQVSSVKPKSTP